MHIKSITIHNFKSYKSTTLESTPLSPRHNVIIGRNGSGKSNFFAAVRFVLGDAFSSMSREERQSLLHEGVNPTISAYVELVLDNSDNRLPGKDEIGLKKDEYSIDKKTATRTELVNLLESAGFAKSNPYYIVPQGRITALTNAKDHERLGVLRDVAGTSVYEQKRIDSLKLIKETETKKAKIGELMDFIAERMKVLEGEKKEFRVWQQKDRERRSIQYAVYTKEQQEIDAQLEEQANQSDIQGTVEQRQAEIKHLETQIALLSSNCESLAREREELNAEREDSLKRRAALDLELGDAQQNAQKDQKTLASLQSDLERFNVAIAQKERSLAEIEPRLLQILDQERALDAQFVLILHRIKELTLEKQMVYAQQGRKFTSRQERDSWIRAEIKKVEATLAAQRQQLALVDMEIQDATSQLENCVAPEETGTEEQLSDFEARERKIRQARFEKEEERKSLWRRDAALTARIQSLSAQVSTAKRTLDSTMDRASSTGLSSITKIAARLSLADQVYGPLYKLFTTDQVYHKAISTIASQSLFHIVVNNDTTATSLLSQLLKDKNGGRVTLMPLNRLSAKSNSGALPADVVRVLDVIEFSPAHAAALHHVFGKAVICPSLDVADVCARSHGLVAVTLDGDRVGKRGELSGGAGTRGGRMEAITALETLESQLSQATLECTQVNSVLVRVEDELVNLRNSASALEREKAACISARRAHILKVEEHAREEIRLKDTLSLSRQARETLVQVKTYTHQQTTDLNLGLTAAEKSRISLVSAKINELEAELVGIVNQRVALTQEKRILEIELCENLVRRRGDLERRIQDCKGHNADFSSVESGALDARLLEITNRLSEIADLDSFATLESTRANLESLLVCSPIYPQNTQQQDQATIQDHAKTLLKHSSKKATLTKKSVEVATQLRELGLVPDAAFEKYCNMPYKSLMAQLHSVTALLEKYTSVNKKAVDQFNNFCTQRTSLEKRRVELEASGDAIQELITNLDERKNEAIQSTFKQVAKNFEIVWEKLVPQGKGRLEMICKDGSVEYADDPADILPPEESQPQPEMDRYAGMAINVSFDSTNTALRMSQLSGGQKSLVALCLIFAIQSCDPAPFYLFDEIDAALDSQYRTAVADMIHEQSDTAQFITTTFRPEMLEGADAFYGVTFLNKVSKVQGISRDDAREFVELEQPR